MDGLRPTRTPGQTRVEALLLEALQHVADRLVVAAERRRDPGHPLPTGACQQDLAAPHHKRILGAQPDRKSTALRLGQFTNQYGGSHPSRVARSTPFPTTRRGSALSTSAHRSPATPPKQQPLPPAA